MSRPSTALAVSVCLALLPWTPGCVRSVPEPGGGQAESPDLALIRNWEDRRSLGEGRLLSLATESTDARVRARAQRALARIQDAATLDAVLAGLKDADATVRDEAAFAAGELALSWEPLPEEAQARLLEALRASEGAEADAKVRATLLESLGKLGTPGAVQRLTERLQGDDVTVAARAALALGVAARRGGAAVVAQVPLAPAEALLSAERPVEARYAAAYLLINAKRPSVLPALRRCLDDADADVRGLCAKGFGDVGGPEDAVVLGRRLDDAAPRVAAEAARSLAKLSAKCAAACTATDALGALVPRVKRVASGGLAASSEAHPFLALAQQGLPEFGRPVLTALRQALADVDPRAVSDIAHGDLAWLDCRLAAALDRQTGTPAEVMRCGFGRVPEARRLALGLREVAQSPVRDGAAFAVGYLRHPDARVKLTALEVVQARPVPEAAVPVRELVASDDLVVAGAAAATAGKLKDVEALPAIEALAARVPKEPGDLAEPVAGALVALQGPAAEPRLREWLRHPHANLRRVAAESLSTLTGQQVRSQRVELPEDTFRPPAAPPRSGLVLATMKGDITVRLDTEEAPFTSGNLVALANKGYFKDITFHRVVPDFVAQGGDPRGDGEGGPGYSIRCEMTRRPYHRGAIGMALAGKDTGGSQFFFTHAPQPHLDGRYTAFGEVVGGMDVVDALTEGDVIREARVVQLPNP